MATSEAILRQLGRGLAGLEDSDVDVRRAAVQILAKLEPAVLATHAEAIVKRLENSDVGVRQAAVQILAKLEPACFAARAALAVAKSLEDPFLRAQSADVLLSSLDCLDRRYVRLLESKGETVLHAAAKAGELRVCQRLVRLGVRLKPTFRVGWSSYTPEDLARSNGHSDVENFLQSRSNLQTVRGGTGDAFEAAMGDDRPITALTWHTIPLPGAAGAIGAFHSLLQVTVGRAKDSEMYVLEKAAALRRSGGEHIKNGVHLSYWIDVAPNVDDDDFAFASGDDIATKTMKIRDLREIAVALGEYDVVKANCHHAALAAYNACVVPAKQQSLPNAHHIKLAKGLALLGIDVGNSRSSASGSTSASVSTGSEEQFTISNNCESFDHSAALVGARLSSWIYLPDSTSVLNIVNTTSRELVVSFDSAVRRNLSPKESTSIADSELGADKLTLSRPRWTDQYANTLAQNQHLAA